jgi:hypothetical protein
MIVSTSVSNPVQTPDVRLDEISGVTAAENCAECGSSFESQGKHHLYCSSACRQRAYRRSPAHRKRLDGLKTQRLNRRNDQVRRRNKFRYFSFDGLHSGNSDMTVPSVGQLNLKRYAKVVA